MPDVNGPLAAYTTLRLGGPARRLVVAKSAQDIVQGLREAALAGEPTLVLAGGSNVVVDDAGFPGTAILVRSTGFTTTTNGDTVCVTLAAGQPWDGVVAEAVDTDWSGIECLAGIPGSAGATPIQNVGAYGQEIAETITAVRAYDRVADELVTLSPAQCGFGYRTSAFKRSARWAVLSVDLRLTRSRMSMPIRYAELAGALGVPLGASAPVREVHDAVLGLRAGKGMVLDDRDPDTYSVGSFFTNPVLDGDAYQALARCAGREPTSWPAPDGTVKVSAAWLIEKAGFTKGYAAAGAVGISGKHTLALTNRGTGSTDALLALAREIRDGVHATFGVTLHTEPVLVNCAL
ncbi:MAG TPA: UDP-N-acetylmuramate dehydrogenase [Micromonosporaceae bacterium]|nr:UDP-N-acetylmuramate dehydrogenase [Micromonosporaceae bacterium]